MQEKLSALTDREKVTLRLLASGHDTKSAAGALEVSVHSINERLREARRKLGTTSSREAARILSECEGKVSQETWNKKVGLDEAPSHVPNEAYPAKRRVKQVLLLGSLGVGIMLVFAMVATLFTTSTDKQVSASNPAISSSIGSASPEARLPSKGLRPTYLVTVDGTLRGQSVASSQMTIQAGSMASLSSASTYDMHLNVTPDPKNDGKLLISVNVVIPGKDATSRYSRTLSVANGQAANFTLEAIGTTPSPGSLAITARTVDPRS